MVHELSLHKIRVLYNRNKKIQEHAEAIKSELLNGSYDDEVRISQIKGVGVKLQNWLKDCWNNKKEMILNTFEKYNLTIY
ncbi:hypothetical protein [Bacillus cereus]|uniref:hypothetical protein n=1 Tax=Bacillus cereus TaxID=1396 RepID=UPI0009459B85|nr:hypothetical protein [Bacillus cereus]